MLCRVWYRLKEITGGLLPNQLVRCSLSSGFHTCDIFKVNGQLRASIFFFEFQGEQIGNTD